MKTKLKTIPPLRVKFLEAVEQRRLAPNTQKAYTKWIKEFVTFHHPRLPSQLGGSEVAKFLTFLVTKRKVSASTQHLAFNALVFFFRYVLNKELGQLPYIPRALRRTRRQYALTHSEFQEILSHIPEKLRLIFLVIYGCGLRISEASNLRVQDINLEQDLLVLRNTKSRTDRAVRIPITLKIRLKEHLALRRRWQFQLEKKRNPNMSLAEVEKLTTVRWNNEFVFISSRIAYNNDSKMFCMQAVSPSYLQKVFKTAKNTAKIKKAATPHSLRYSYATEASRAGNNLAELQITLGHKDPNTTARYIDVTETIRKVSSPLDSLPLPENETTTENTESITPTTLPPSRFTAMCNYLLNLLKIQTKN